MKWIKYISLMLFGLVLTLFAIGYYLLQPSGKVSDFSAWQPQKLSTNTALTVHFFGVSTLLFDDGTDQILIDGFFSRPSLWQVISHPLNANQAVLNTVIQDYDLKRTKAIFVTHSHYDHALDLTALMQHLPHTQLIGSHSSLRIVNNNTQGTMQRLHLADTQQPFQFGAFKVTAIPSAHTPPTAVNNDLGEEISTDFHLPARFSEFKEGGSFDYLIEHREHKILVKASTGLIPKQYQNLKVDTLFLGIAQLSRQSKQYQQAYLKESLHALQPQQVIPIHWDDFFQAFDQPRQFLPRLADHAPQSMQILIKAAKQQGTALILLTEPQAYPLSSQAQ